MSYTQSDKPKETIRFMGCTFVVEGTVSIMVIPGTKVLEIRGCRFTEPGNEQGLDLSWGSYDQDDK